MMWYTNNFDIISPDILLEFHNVFFNKCEMFFRVSKFLFQLLLECLYYVVLPIVNLF